jgi:5'-methylthioadenosine phosphorylase
MHTLRAAIRKSNINVDDDAIVVECEWDRDRWGRRWFLLRSAKAAKHHRSSNRAAESHPGIVAPSLMVLARDHPAAVSFASPPFSVLYNQQFDSQVLFGGYLQAEIGIIGGSGLYSMPGLTKVKEMRLKTPFGAPSDAYVCGSLEGRKVAFLARHARGHRILPSELNFRANIHGFKQLGVERIVSISAVGSLREEHKPLDFVIPDQFFDRTRHRIDTFFGSGVVAHIAFADPICAELASVVEAACKEASVVGKRGGTYICIEGPQFSTKAESNVYRGMAADVIGMTNLQEAKLAREAELCYVTVAMVTDYDCWHPHHDSVTVDQIVAVLIKNAENATKVLRATVAAMPQERSCKCGSALAHAILTDPRTIPAATKKKLKLILGKYVK